MKIGFGWKFIVESLQRSWKMTLRGLDPKVIADVRDVVEKNISKMSDRLEASLTD